VERARIPLEAGDPGPGSKLSAPLKIDEYLFTKEARRLGFAPKRHLVERLPEHCRHHSHDLIVRERDFYAQAAVPRLSEFYSKLESISQDLTGNQFLLQMGWGTGWQGMTLGSAIAEDEEFAAVRARFRLGRQGAPLPKTRRLVQRGRTPIMPLGWLKLEMMER